jgi:hypothetical protein
LSGCLPLLPQERTLVERPALFPFRRSIVMEILAPTEGLTLTGDLCAIRIIECIPPFNRQNTEATLLIPV